METLIFIFRDKYVLRWTMDEMLNQKKKKIMEK